MGRGIVYCGDCGDSLREDAFERGRAHWVDDVPYCSACRAPDPTPPTGTHKIVQAPRAPGYNQVRMGRPIVYCVNCGRSLKEDEFLQRQAHMVENRPWCAICKPLPAEAPISSRSVPTRRPSSGQIPAATPRRPMPAAPARSNGPLLAGVALAVAAFAILAVVMLSGGTSAPPSPRANATAVAAAPDRAGRTIDDLERFAAGGGDPRAVLARAQEARPLLNGTPHAARLKAVEDRARATLENALPAAPAVDATDRYIAMIRELRERDTTFRRRGEAKNLIEATRRQAGARAGEIDRIAAEYDRAFEAAARKAADDAAADARALAAKGQGADALARLGEIPPAFVETEAVRKLAALREELLRAPETAAPGRAAAEAVPAITLKAASAKLKGILFKNNDYLGNWHTDGDTAEWMAAPGPGRWTVEIVYAADATAGGTLTLALGAARLEWEVASTGSFKTFRTVALGVVTLPGGATPILARGKGTREKGLLNLREIRLIPAP